MRELYLRERGLLGCLAASFAQMLQWYLKKNCRHPRARPGIILVTQTFGEKLNPNPHFQCDVQGCTSAGGYMDVQEPALVTTMNVDPATGGFHETRLPSFAQLRHNWMNRALGLAHRTKQLSLKECMRLKIRYPNGFHVHVSQPEAKTERQYGEEKETRAQIIASVGKYLVRTPLTEARIAARDPEKRTVTLRHRGYAFGDDGLLHKKPQPDFDDAQGSASAGESMDGREPAHGG